MIPVTAIIVTKNEGENLSHCLLPLVTNFARVVVVDSASTDDTMEIAKSMGADFIPYTWDGRYPKKRQWCLENIFGLGDWVLFIDADEVISPALIREMTLLFARKPQDDGYFVRGRYVWMNRLLRFGMPNNKLCLFKRSAFAFPPVDDLKIPGMGEIEGHYQPMPTIDNVRIGQLSAPVIHHNRKGRGDWMRRHDRYAQWESQMIAEDAFPPDPIDWRDDLKKATRGSSFRPMLIFLYSYVIRLGFLDGVAGLDYAMAKAGYARNVIKRLRSIQ